MSRGREADASARATPHTRKGEPMCGIAGFHVRDASKLRLDLSRLVEELLLGIEHRGGDATGYACLTEQGAFQSQKASCDAWDFLKGCRPLPSGVRSCILHTRWATKG